VSLVALPEGARGPRVRNVTLVVTIVTLLAAGVWVALRRNDAAPTASGVAKPVPITSFPGLEINPAISPAGNLVAFAWDGERGNNFDIHVRSLDGRSQVQLTFDAASDHMPAWSPDGPRIAFVRVLSGRRVIMEVPALGGPEQALFEAGPPEREALAFGGAAGGPYGLSWTPDGRHLLFGDRNASAFAAAIYQYSLDDGQRRQLTSPPANFSDGRPIVSPDGRYLGFVRRNDSWLQGWRWRRVGVAWNRSFRRTGDASITQSNLPSRAPGGASCSSRNAGRVSGQRLVPAFPTRRYSPLARAVASYVVYSPASIAARCWPIRTPNARMSDLRTRRARRLRC